MFFYWVTPEMGNHFNSHLLLYEQLKSAYAHRLTAPDGYLLHLPLICVTFLPKTKSVL
jgi:hypothetical protein